MKYAFYLITGLLALAAIWRIGLDRAGQPARPVFDTPARPSVPRSPHPAGVVPFGAATTATGSGAELFSIHCAHCHGAAGNGHSYTAAQPGMPAVGNLQTTERTAEELRLILENGRGAMPAFEPRLRAADHHELLMHIHTLKP